MKNVEIINEPVNLQYTESSYAKLGQLAPMEDLQIRTGLNPNISNKRFYSMVVSSTSWATGDWTARKIKLVWNNWEIAKSYSTEIITWLWSTTFTLSKRSTMNTPTNSSFTLPALGIMQIDCSFTNTTQTITITTTWGTLSYLLWSSLALTRTNPSIIITNTSTSRMTIDLNFSTSASDRPNFGIFLQSL